MCLDKSVGIQSSLSTMVRTIKRGIKISCEAVKSNLQIQNQEQGIGLVETFEGDGWAPLAVSPITGDQLTIRKRLCRKAGGSHDRGESEFHIGDCWFEAGGDGLECREWMILLGISFMLYMRLVSLYARAALHLECGCQCPAVRLWIALPSSMFREWWVWAT